MKKQLGGVVAGAAMVVLVPAAAQAVVVADWEMDESAGATVMVDSVGNHNGNINSVATGVDGLVGDGGAAYQFDGVTSWVDIPDPDGTLNPGSADMTITATVKVADATMTDDSYEVIRKGLVTSKGGDWKMEIKRKGTNATVGKLHCVFKGVLPNGTNSLAGVSAAKDIVDGQVHKLQCVRTSTGVQAIVDDGLSVGKLTKASGNIANAVYPLIGSKVQGDDVMQGVIDQVKIDIG